MGLVTGLPTVAVHQPALRVVFLFLLQLAGRIVCLAPVLRIQSPLTAVYLRFDVEQYSGRVDRLLRRVLAGMVGDRDDRSMSVLISLSNGFRPMDQAVNRLASRRCGHGLGCYGSLGVLAVGRVH